MNQPITFLKNSILVLLAAVYLLTPLAGAIVEGLHKFSHAIAKTTSHHHHGNHVTEHGHSHETISFIAELFSEKQQNETNEEKPSVKIDKDISRFSYTLNTPQRIFRTNNFHYLLMEVTFHKSLESPPPQV